MISPDYFWGSVNKIDLNFPIIKLITSVLDHPGIPHDNSPSDRSDTKNSG